MESTSEHCSGGFYRLEGMAFPDRFDCVTIPRFGVFKEVATMLKFLAFIGLLAIVVAIAAAVFFFGGFYSVAATDADPALVDRMLIQVRQASIARRAKDTPPAEDGSAVQAGARAYATRGCVNCHGAPGVDWAKWSEGMRPYPPDLKEISGERQPAELFWVIRNGIKMTAMPGFAATGAKDEEIWKIVAFVKKWETVKPEDYKAWTESTTGTQPPG
jgi:mono/diheme cytochrome c family protein